MTVASLLFLLLAGTVLQAMLPAFEWAGYSTFPVLACVVLYVALFRGPGLTLSAALLAGLFQDSLSLMPMGYSSFCFAVAALVIREYRDVMVVQSPLTHMVLSAVMHASVTTVLAALLLNEGVIPWHSGLLLKVPGSFLLGIVTGPFVIAAAQALEEKLGLIEGSSDNDGAQRSYYGLG